jgi:glycosyltransferase involved in cell wall biosynthesis
MGGLVVTEANAMGTPAIGYGVRGLSDSIRYDETEIKVLEKSRGGAMAQQAISLRRDPKRLSNYSKNALEYARQFNWDKTVEALQKFLDNQNETKADVIRG